MHTKTQTTTFVATTCMYAMHDMHAMWFKIWQLLLHQLLQQLQCLYVVHESVLC